MTYWPFSRGLLKILTWEGVLRKQNLTDVILCKQTHSLTPEHVLREIETTRVSVVRNIFLRACNFIPLFQIYNSPDFRCFQLSYQFKFLAWIEVTIIELSNLTIIELLLTYNWTIIDL